MDNSKITSFLATKVMGWELSLDKNEWSQNGELLRGVDEFDPIHRIDHAFMLFPAIKALGQDAEDAFEYEMGKGYEYEGGWTSQYIDITPEQICHAAVRALADDDELKDMELDK